LYNYLVASYGTDGKTKYRVGGERATSKTQAAKQWLARFPSDVIDKITDRSKMKRRPRRPKVELVCDVLSITKKIVINDIPTLERMSRRDLENLYFVMRELITHEFSRMRR